MSKARLSLLMFSLGVCLVGCQRNGNSEFEAKGRGQQIDALKGSMDQLSPERKKEIEAQAKAIMAAHGGQAGAQAGKPAAVPAGNH